MDKKRVILFLLFILTLALYTNVIPQEDAVCVICKKPITDKYLIVEGKTFHPEHFLCAKCGKKIEGTYVKKEGKYLHPECYTQAANLVCAYCGKNLEGKYLISEGRNYHKDCYDNFVLAKCVVCGQPLRGTYSVDVYGNKFHSAHLNELPKCDCCDRLISQGTTGGGRELSDGRHICNLCYATSVYNQRDIERAFDLTAQRLIGIGINLDLNKLKVVGVDRNGLTKKSENFTENMQGYCDSQTQKEYINNKLVKKITSHTIYVLNYLPSATLESVIAHELMHSWLYENTENSHPARTREGACNYISYLYLKELAPKTAADALRKLENNPDPVYGGGFRELRNKFENRPVREFLSNLKNN